MENTQSIDGVRYAQMVQAGADNLREHVQYINNLNVFPIPDGDTGDNMLLTMIGGVDTVDYTYSDLSKAAHSISDGMLLGARGNSGVILSQIFEGISDGLSGYAVADVDTFIKAMQEGVRHAYQAVMEPTEGTILTVMRCAVEGVAESKPADMGEMLLIFMTEAKKTLKRTPDLLPVLKKAGVVDSGGAGLIYIFEGMMQSLCGDRVHHVEEKTTAPSEQKLDISLFTEDSVLEYGYCTELLLRLQRCKTDPETFDVDMLTDALKSIGDSVVAFKTGSIVKIHIHTMTPDRVLALCRNYGEFLKVKIENMSLQHNNIEFEYNEESAKENSEKKPYGVVAVASGEGICQLFLDRGVDVIVEGGQTMNPSTEDFLHAFSQVDANTILVFPNNSNIILTAKQAAAMYTVADVRVLESHTIGDGYAALTMLSYDTGDVDSIIATLQDAMEGVVTAYISKSIRSTDEVNKGDYVGIIGENIVASDENKVGLVHAMMGELGAGCYDICLMICGNTADTHETDSIVADLGKTYPDLEVYKIDGKQDIYDYILILE